MTDLKRRVASHKILQFLQNNKVIFFFQKKSVQSDHWRLLKKKIARIEGVASLNLKNKRDKREIQPLILSYLACQGSMNAPLNSSKRVDSFMQNSAKRHKEISSPALEPASIETFASQLEVGSSHAFRKAISCFPEKNKISHASRKKLCNVLSHKTLSHHATLHANILQSKMSQGDDILQSEILQGGSINVGLDSENENQLEIVERICGLLYAPNLILGSHSLKKLAHLSNQLTEDSNLIFIGGWDGNQLINHLDSLKLLETPQDIWKEGVSCLSSSYARPYLFLHSLLEKRKNLLVYSLKEKMHALVRSLQERKAQQIKEQTKEQTEEQTEEQ